MRWANLGRERGARFLERGSSLQRAEKLPLVAVDGIHAHRPFVAAHDHGIGTFMAFGRAITRGLVRAPDRLDGMGGAQQPNRGMQREANASISAGRNACERSEVQRRAVGRLLALLACPFEARDVGEVGKRLRAGS